MGKVFILSIILMVSLLACSQNLLAPEPVKRVDLVKYSGVWYEIARFPNNFQKNCDCTTAEYIIVPGKSYIQVVNRCFDFKKNESNFVKGKAFVADTLTNARLKVQFFWPFKSDYWIIGLDEAYNWAIVSTPNREYLWILSRTKTLSDSTFNLIKDQLLSKKFDLSKLYISKQTCN